MTNRQTGWYYPSPIDLEELKTQLDNQPQGDKI